MQNALETLVITQASHWSRVWLLRGLFQVRRIASSRPAQGLKSASLSLRSGTSLRARSTYCHGRVFTTLDFIDAQHLLFTFHEPRLLQREATSTGKLESDQIIRALVISLPGGEVTASEEWRMHDRSRYLWPIGAGKFLVRQRSTYLLTDASLQLRPYLEVPTTVLQTDVSPDGRVLVVEHEYEKHTTSEHEHLQQQALQYGDTPPREDTQITLLDIASRKVLAAIRTELPTLVPISAAGYVGGEKRCRGSVRSAVQTF